MVLCYFVKYSRMWQRGSGEWILIPNKIRIELLVEEVNMLSVEQTSKSIRWNLWKMPIHRKVLCEKISKWNCGGGCSLASNRSWEVTFKWERWVFAIPQSAKQTGAICAQKLVLISTCLSDVLRRDERQPPQLALGFVNHSACAKFTYLYLWIYWAHGTKQPILHIDEGAPLDVLSGQRVLFCTFFSCSCHCAWLVHQPAHSTQTLSKSGLMAVWKKCSGGTLSAFRLLEDIRNPELGLWGSLNQCNFISDPHPHGIDAWWKTFWHLDEHKSTQFGA